MIGNLVGRANEPTPAILHFVVANNCLYVTLKQLHCERHLTLEKADDYPDQR